jgi:hypothetical protein
MNLGTLPRLTTITSKYPPGMVNYGHYALEPLISSSASFLQEFIVDQNDLKNVEVLEVRATRDPRWDLWSLIY